jgi:ribonuclease HII
VVAGAVCLKKNLISKTRNLIAGLNDSKKLTAAKREELFKFLTSQEDIKWGIGIVSEKVIDKINILEASKLAMKKAVAALEKKEKAREADFLLLDGNFKININVPQKSIIKGDQKVFSCAAASILAKVTRDKMMLKYHKKYPKYGFDQHKGYPTKFHFKALEKHGPCKLHRKTFWPVSKFDKSTKSA